MAALERSTGNRSEAAEWLPRSRNLERELAMNYR